MKTLVLTFSAIALLTMPALAASPRISAGEPIVVAQVPEVSVGVGGDRDRDRDHKTVIVKKHGDDSDRDHHRSDDRDR
ncbi:MAG TPA: hypothetical protein VMQ54_03985 [Steroidobacteraceae bacterium]|jgi:hypothetical protein|nr:hypothetical protein [Steroidobacteraceae bacterium]